MKFVVNGGADIPALSGTGHASAPGDFPPPPLIGSVGDFHQWVRSWRKRALTQDSQAAKSLLEIVERLLTIDNLDAAKAAADGFMLWALHLEVVRIDVDRHRASVRGRSASKQSIGKAKSLTGLVLRRLLADGIDSAADVLAYLQNHGRLIVDHHGKPVEVSVDVDGENSVSLVAEGWPSREFSSSSLGVMLTRLRKNTKR